MADYKFKHDTIQAMQVTDADFEIIYEWAASLNAASNKTETSFTLAGNNEFFSVKKGSNVWVLKLPEEWVVVSDKRMLQLFVLA